MAAIHTTALSKSLAACALAWLALASPAGMAKEIKSPRAASVANAEPAFRVEGKLRTLALAPPDVAKLQREDEVRDFSLGAPLRYGVVRKLGRLSVDDIGQWRAQTDGSWRWTLKVSASGARSLEFDFSRFRLPYGASLSIRSADGKRVLPALTDADNPASGRLHTAMVESGQAVLELSVPAAAKHRVELVLDSVTWGYRSPFDISRSKSGSCNIDVACPEGDDWRNQISSVALYLFNGSACTGTLIATGDRAADLAQPRFATAHHCVSSQEDADGVVLYWGYESPSCRAPGSSASGQTLPFEGHVAAIQTGGATLLATDRATDFTALQLNTPVPLEAQAYYSGWDRSGSVPTGSVAIHHPSGDEKRISFDFDPLTTQANCIVSSSQPDTHWRVSQYERGTTEQGSSGAGLWDSNSGLLVGVLSGGSASCSTLDGYDCYGRLSVAWQAQGTTPGSFQAAFDRSGTNPQTQPGMDTCDAPQVTLASNAFVQGVRAGEPATFSASATGGTGPIEFSWDLDSDGRIDQQGGAQITATYPSAGPMQVRVFATDATGCRGQASHALDVIGPELTAQLAGTPTQVCGNGDAKVDPGERWSVPVRLSNNGTTDAPAGAFALFAPTNSMPPFGPNAFGYTGTSSANGGCAFDFIDIASGPYAVPALTTSVANGNDYGPLDDARSTEIALGGSGFPIYGQAATVAVMSTNGYVSFNPAETGGDFAPSCDGEFGEGAVGPQLRPYHDDLVVNERPGAGLRYRYFAQCPRPAEAGAAAQGCHVFQWTGMGYYGLDDDFEFQAIAYEQSGQVSYQYRTAASDVGELASIGLIDAAGQDVFSLSCQQFGATPAQSAFCMFTPDATPAASALRVEKPAIELPAIAAGASVVVDAPVAFDASLSCNAAPTLELVAVAGATFSSVESTRLDIGALQGGACQAVTNCPVPATEIDSRRGYFHDPARRGNGFVNFPYGGLWFTADADRNTTWYEVSGSYRDNLMQTGILRVTTASGEAAYQRVGTATVARIDANRQLYAWRFDDGRSGAELHEALYPGKPRPAANHTELWFNPSEVGWGLALEEAVLDGSSWLGASAFLYDAAGAPRWVLARGIAKSTATPLYSYRPHCPGCPWIAGWDESETVAGSLEFTFTGKDHAKLDIDVNLPAPLEGTLKRDALDLIPIKEPVQ